jgi:hypothetical protein
MTYKTVADSDTGNVVSRMIGLRPRTYDLWHEAVVVGGRMEFARATVGVRFNKLKAKLLLTGDLTENPCAVDVKSFGQ